MIFRTLLLCFLLLMQDMAIAGDQAPVDTHLGRIAIKTPAGLNGPDRSSPNKASELLIYYSPKESPPTLLQLTQILTPAAPDVTEKAKQEAATHFLSGFLQTFSQNVQEWKRSPIDKVQLGQYMAVRATWTGNFHGLPQPAPCICLYSARSRTASIHLAGRTSPIPCSNHRSRQSKRCG